MSCPIPADMSKCTPKSRCTSGACAGVAYDPSNPCPDGARFDLFRCECLVETGWVYSRQVSTGLCEQFGASGSPYLCPGSFVTSTGRTYYGNYVEGDPIPTLAWEASTSWEVGGQKSGIMSLGQNITAQLEPDVQATSDNTPWDIPTTTAAVSGDQSTCTDTFSNCGAVRVGANVASSTLYFDLLPYPADKDAYCAGLTDEECFLVAYDDYGPG